MHIDSNFQLAEILFKLKIIQLLKVKKKKKKKTSPL